MRGLDILALCCTLCLVMLKALTIAEYVVSVLLVGSILLQHRGTGLGGAFASSGNVYRSKRGIEKFLFNSTIAMAAILVMSVMAHLIIRIKTAA